jgi:hypothetical protein
MPRHDSPRALCPARGDAARMPVEDSFSNNDPHNTAVREEEEDLGGSTKVPPGAGPIAQHVVARDAFTSSSSSSDVDDFESAGKAAGPQASCAATGAAGPNDLGSSTKPPPAAGPVAQLLVVRDTPTSEKAEAGRQVNGRHSSRAAVLEQVSENLVRRPKSEALIARDAFAELPPPSSRGAVPGNGQAPMTQTSRAIRQGNRVMTVRYRLPKVR